MVIQISNSLFKASLEEKKMKNKRKKDGLQGIFFSISYSCLFFSMKTHQCFFCIFDIFNNYGLKSLQNNTGEAVHSRSRSYN